MVYDSLQFGVSEPNITMKGFVSVSGGDTDLNLIAKSRGAIFWVFLPCAAGWLVFLLFCGRPIKRRFQLLFGPLSLALILVAGCTEAMALDSPISCCRAGLTTSRLFRRFCCWLSTSEARSLRACRAPFLRTMTVSGSPVLHRGTRCLPFPGLWRVCWCYWLQDGRFTGKRGARNCSPRLRWSAPG